MNSYICLLLAALACFGHASAAPKGHLLTNMPGPLGTMQVFHAFADSGKEHKMEVGEEVEVLLTIRNQHNAPVNVTYIAGSINSPTDFRQHFQNLTTAAYKSLVQTRTDRSFAFKFTPDARLPTRGFYVALTVFYHLSGSSSNVYSTTFFNQTVDIIEKDKLIDTEALSLYVILALILFAAGNGVYMMIKDVPAIKALTKKNKKTSAAKVEPTGDRSDYLVGTSLYLSKVKREKAEAKKGK